MNSNELSDSELGALFREKARGCGYSPIALLELASHWAEDHWRTVMPSQSFTMKPGGGWEYHAKLEDDFIFQESDVENLPEFITPLIKEGHRVEAWKWDDGVRVVRLLDSRSLVLGSKIL